MSMTDDLLRLTKVARGQLRLIPASGLAVIPELQRQPTDARINALKNKWDDDKALILIVAEITDGEHEGLLHIVDGGTRWRAVKLIDADYEFECYVRPMTYKQAAITFLTLNGESMKPNALSQYIVGLAAGSNDARAVKSALRERNLEPTLKESRYALEGVPGRFRPLGKALSICREVWKDTSSWKKASETFAFCMALGERAYPGWDDRVSPGRTDQAHGLDGDILGAIFRIVRENPLLLDTEEDEIVINGLALTVGAKNPGEWKAEYTAYSKSVGGSRSRGETIARLMITQYNRGKPKRLKLEGGLNV